MRETKERGITLIALIITVIVMLILAGVAINLTVGDNGIFKKSSEGAQIYKNAAANEATSLNSMDAEMEELIANINKEFRIYTKADLMEFATRVNNGESFAGYQVYLENDIDLSEGGQEEWRGIGIENPREGIHKVFAGVFEGKNHTVSNMYMSERDLYMGLFKANDGTIRNLNVQGVVECSTEFAVVIGGIVAVNNGIVEDCNADMNIALPKSNLYYQQASTLVSENNKIVRNCTAKGRIEVGSKVGYFAGVVAENSGTVEKCINESVIATLGIMNDGAIGGIVGRNDEVVSKCINKGNIEAATGRVGGIVGRNHKKIEQCANIASIETTTSSFQYAPYLGGICGQGEGESIILNCYNAGEIIKGEGKEALGIGGILRRWRFG